MSRSSLVFIDEEGRNMKTVRVKQLIGAYAGEIQEMEFVAATSNAAMGTVEILDHVPGVSVSATPEKAEENSKVEELIALTGVGAKTAEKLIEAGFPTLLSIVETRELKPLAEIAGSEERAEAMIEEAAEILEAEDG